MRIDGRQARYALGVKERLEVGRQWCFGHLARCVSS